MRGPRAHTGCAVAHGFPRGFFCGSLSRVLPRKRPDAAEHAAEHGVMPLGLFWSWFTASAGAPPPPAESVAVEVHGPAGPVPGPSRAVWPPGSGAGGHGPALAGAGGHNPGPAAARPRAGQDPATRRHPPGTPGPGPMSRRPWDRTATSYAASTR